MTDLFCFPPSLESTYCFFINFSGGVALWYGGTLLIGFAMVTSSLIWPWGGHIDSNDHIFVLIEAIKVAALFFLILTPEQLASFQCTSPASLGQIIGPNCAPNANLVTQLQCNPQWYSDAGYTLSDSQLSDLASVCGVPSFLFGYFFLLAAEIITMAYLFIVKSCILPLKGEKGKRSGRFSNAVFVWHLGLMALSAGMWGIYELFVSLSYSQGTCALPVVGGGIVLRAFCSLYLFAFCFILVVAIHRYRNRRASPRFKRALARITRPSSTASQAPSTVISPNSPNPNLVAAGSLI